LGGVGNNAVLHMLKRRLDYGPRIYDAGEQQRNDAYDKPMPADKLFLFQMV
jgi:hypothetical protein